MVDRKFLFINSKFWYGYFKGERIFIIWEEIIIQRNKRWRNNKRSLGITEKMDEEWQWGGKRSYLKHRGHASDAVDARQYRYRRLPTCTRPLHPFDSPLTRPDNSRRSNRSFFFFGAHWWENKNTLKSDCRVCSACKSSRAFSEWRCNVGIPWFDKCAWFFFGCLFVICSFFYIFFST